MIEGVVCVICLCLLFGHVHDSVVVRFAQVCAISKMC